jgi:ferredoxin
MQLPLPANRMDGARAALYQALAEALDEPAEWLAAPGDEWPLYSAASALQGVSPAAAEAVARLAAIPAEPLAARRARYRSLVDGNGRAPIALYESLARRGLLLGAETAQVERFYHAAGLAVPEGDLPDHACLELAFLARLAQQAEADAAHAAQWRRIERQFARRHPSRWLPQVGQTLAASGDPVYAPVGELLAGWLAEAARKQPVAAVPAASRLPVMAAAGCTLCGFCVQACPAGALAIREDATWTSLILAAGRCSGCARCVPACPAGAIRLQAVAAGERQQPLFRSPRAQCPACAQPTVSEAELAFVASQIGHPPWLDYCLSCRT